MKKVFSSHEMTAHVWAQREQNEGRASDKRMFFENDTIYSYGRHFAIAKFASTLKGDDVVLFNDNNYSVSTSKHKSLTLRALRNDAFIVYCPAPDGSYVHNLDLFDERIKGKLIEHGKAKRDIKRNRIASEMTYLIEKRNAFGAMFIPKFKPMAVPSDMAKAAETLRKEEAKKEAARRAAQLAQQEEYLRRIEEEYGVKRDGWLDYWRKHGDRETHYKMRDYINADTMRLRLAGENVMTSGGAEFPISHARRVWPVLKAMRDGKQYGTVLETALRLGHFRIDSLHEKGLQAGCHFVAWPEVDQLAATLGLS